MALAIGGGGSRVAPANGGGGMPAFPDSGMASGAGYLDWTLIPGGDEFLLWR